MEIVNYTKEIAILTLRLFLAFLFFFQGYEGVFRIGLHRVTDTYFEGFKAKGIPYFITVSAAWFTSLSALIGGLLLIFGLFTPYAYCLLCANLVITVIGFGLLDPLWDLRHSFPRLILLSTLMLLPPQWDTLQLDKFLFNHI